MCIVFVVLRLGLGNHRGQVFDSYIWNISTEHQIVSKRFHPRWLRFGFMPAHPSFYARKNVLEKAGPYKTDYKIGSDYEMMVRLFRKQQIHAKYLPIDFVTMRTGGLSTRSVQSRIQLIRDDIRACRENGVYTNALFISLKFLYKIFEFKF